jgi:hypothetical protein
MLHASGLFVGFIGASSPRATVEEARRSRCANPRAGLRPPALFLGPSSAVKRVASRRRKTKAAVEALLGSLDHKCTSVHLAPGEQVCLVYTEEGGRLHANQGQGGQKSLTFEVSTALRFHSTHPAAFPAIGGRMFFKSLTYLGPGPKALRRLPQPTKVRAPPAFWRQFFLVEPSGARWVLLATGYIARQPKGRTHSGRVLLRHLLL